MRVSMYGGIMKIRPRNIGPIALALATTTGAHAAEKLETIQVENARERMEREGQLKDVVQQTEVVTQQRIEDKNASTLIDVVDEEAGVNVNNSCSMCAIKRVMINGMKGEHTTVLVDGVPMHSNVSSFYGMDAVTASGIERVEIARGAGASLIAPEAIGGTINIVTRKADRDGISADIGFGEHGYEKIAVAGTAVADDGASRATISAQSDQRDQFDGDDNGVSENPSRDNRSIMAKFSRDIDATDTVDLRLAAFRSSMFGGPTGVTNYEAVRSESVRGESASSSDYFYNSDVREQWIGAPWETTEAIDTERDEATLRWTHRMGAAGDLQLTGSLVRHAQDSYYESFDYANEDDTAFMDARYNRAIGMSHFLTAGVDYKKESMESHSLFVRDHNEGAAPGDRIEGDDFEHADLGIYLQDIWTPTRDLEVKLAARVDRITTDWTQQKAEEDEIDTTVVSPRAHIRWIHSEHWSSRFAAGRGYRTPLTFFESEHGLLETGFDTDIDEVESSQSASYALSYESEAFSATGSLAHTRVENLAYIEDDGVARPTLRNSEDTAKVTTTDLSAGTQLGGGFRVDANAVHFDYSSDYQKTFMVAPVEDRLRLMGSYEGGPWRVNSTVTWVGSRDLADYGYDDRYNRWDDANDNGEVDSGELTDPKGTDAPAWFTVDLKVSRDFGETFSAYIGVDNLFDYTQTDEESPLFYEGTPGSGEAAGFDVVHIYAPLRGRVAYAGLKAEF
jgi:outer membrane receptor protein involved in Fe transport